MNIGIDLFNAGGKVEWPIRGKIHRPLHSGIVYDHVQIRIIGNQIRRHGLNAFLPGHIQNDCMHARVRHHRLIEAIRLNGLRRSANDARTSPPAILTGTAVSPASRELNSDHRSPKKMPSASWTVAPTRAILCTSRQPAAQPKKENRCQRTLPRRPSASTARCTRRLDKRYAQDSGRKNMPRSIFPP